MAVVFSFSVLRDTLQSYMERGGSTTDPTVYAFIPTAINLTEQKIARMLKVQGFQRITLSTMQSGLSVYQKPDRWRETISMSIGTGTGNNTWVPIYARDYEYVRAVYSDATSTGTPKYYAEMDYQHWWFSPTPNAAFPFQAAYWELPPLLDDSNQQNWTCVYAPNALLHGCLVELYGFLKNPTERAVWQGEFDIDMAALSGEEVQKILDRMQERKTA